MKRKIFVFITALASAFGLSLSCGAESLNYNNNFGYDDLPSYNEPYWDDYDPAWDMDFGGYLGTFHDRDSGFSAEMFQSAAIISGYEKSDNIVVIPEKIGDKTVIAVSECAFQGNQSITEVKLPNGLKYIGRSAFGNCVNLKSINFPEGMLSIDQGAFYKCGLQAVQFPDSLTFIGKEAFWQCSDLKSVEFSHNIESIGAFAFKESGIEQAHLPEKLNYLGRGAFENCSNLEIVSFTECPEVIEEFTFSNCEKLKDVILAKGLTAIEQNAFYGCAITDIELPEGLIRIESQAFMDCAELSRLPFPERLITVGDSAFEGCKSLEYVNMTDDISDLGDFAFSKCDALKSIRFSSKLKEIPFSAFSYCTELKSVVIPEGIRSIKQEAFAWCEGLEEIYIPDSVTSINSSAFLKEDTSKITIIGSYDSYARAYASRNGISFKVDADEGQMKVMTIVMISVWSAVLVICLVMLVNAGIRKKDTNNNKGDI